MREVHYHSWLSSLVMTGKSNPFVDTLSNVFLTLTRDTTKYKWQRKMRKRQLSYKPRSLFLHKDAFWSKNVGATYQRLMDKAIEKNLPDAKENKHETQPKEVHIWREGWDIPQAHSRCQRDQSMSEQSKSSNTTIIPKDAEGGPKSKLQFNGKASSSLDTRLQETKKILSGTPDNGDYRSTNQANIAAA
ncbi:hypothetical protein Tco_0126413 [Tanacetum coccineum]